MELIKDYDYVIDYHPRKANVVAGALSRKTMQTLRALNAHLSLTDDGTIVTELIARPSSLNRVLEVQKKDEKIAAIVSQIGNGKEIEFIVNEDGVLYYKDQVCVPDDNDLRKGILEEAHSGSFAIHPGSTKMYQDLKMSFWWSRMKRDVSKFVTQVFGLPKGGGRASNSFRIIAAYQNIGVEMRPNYHGFCSWVTIDREKA